MSVTLISKDKQRFTIEKEFAIKSNTIKSLVEEEKCVLSASISSVMIRKPCINLFSIHSETLALVIEFLSTQDENDQKMIFEHLQMPTVIDLVSAASFLEMENMADIACQKVADLVKGKKTEEMRELLGIKSDYTPEEEEALREEEEALRQEEEARRRMLGLIIN